MNVLIIEDEKALAHEIEIFLNSKKNIYNYYNYYKNNQEFVFLS